MLIDPTQKGTWNVVGGKSHNSLFEAMGEASSIATRQPGKPVTINPPSIQVVAKADSIPVPVPTPSPVVVPPVVAPSSPIIEAPLPSINNIYSDIVSGPNSGGENGAGCYLTLWGRGFGAQPGVVLIGGGAAVIKSWSEWRVVVQPGSAARTGSVVINGKDTGIIFSVVPGSIRFVDTGKTVQSALDLAGPGDHIVIRGGERSDIYPQYNSFFSLHHKEGTPTAPIVVMGYPGERVLFKRTSQSRGFHTWATAGHFVFANMVIDAQHSGVGIGLTPGTTDVRVVNNEVFGFFENSGGAAAIDGSGKQYRIFGNHIHDNGGSKLYHGLYFDARDLSGPDDIEIAYNYIHHQGGGRGIQIYGDTPALINRVKIHHNVIHDIALNGILFGRNSGTGHEVHHNLVYRCANPAMRGATNDEGNAGSCLRFADSRVIEAFVRNNTFVDGDLDGGEDSAQINFDVPAKVVLTDNIIVGKRYINGTPGAGSFIMGNVWSGAGSPPAFDIEPLNIDPKLDANFNSTNPDAAGRGAR